MTMPRTCHSFSQGGTANLKLVHMRLLFWFSFAVVSYAYVGYALFLLLLAKIRVLPVQRAAIQPSVSIVIAAHNEELNLPRKVASLQALEYPSDHLQIVVVSDGSTDGTAALLTASRGITSITLPVALGKASALNHGVEAANGEILVFMDARQTVDPRAVSELVSCFADPTVGAVSGELHLVTENGEPSPDALGIYWKIEKLVRKLESRTGSVVGVTGALFAMRRELFVPLPPGTLLDDVLTPMNVARSGKRILFLESAIIRDRLFVDPGKEFGRKVRTLTGNYQLLQLAPWLLSSRNPLLFRLISHKLLRLAVPVLLIIMLFSSALSLGPVYRAAFFAQVLIYALALMGALSSGVRRKRAVSIPYTFVMLNVAAAIAFYNFLAGRARWA